MRMPNQNLNATFVASTYQGIQASKSKLRISAASNLQAGFVASTSKESKRRNPSFEFRPHQTSKPASSHPRPRNPSFGIQASDFGSIKPPSRLRRIHVHEIQASESKDSKLRIFAASNLQAGFVASTSTESKLRNPCFQFRRHRTYTPASSHSRPRNPSFQFRSLLQSM